MRAAAAPVGEAEAEVSPSVAVELSVAVSVADSVSDAVSVAVLCVRRVVGRVNVPLVPGETPVPTAPVPTGPTPVPMTLGMLVGIPLNDVTTEGWLVTTEGWVVTTSRLGVGWVVTTSVLTSRLGVAGTGQRVSGMLGEGRLLTLTGDNTERIGLCQVGGKWV